MDRFNHQTTSKLLFILLLSATSGMDGPDKRRRRNGHLKNNLCRCSSHWSRNEDAGSPGDAYKMYRAVCLSDVSKISTSTGVRWPWTPRKNILVKEHIPPARVPLPVRVSHEVLVRTSRQQEVDGELKARLRCLLYSTEPNFLLTAYRSMYLPICRARTQLK
ncbi:hypothetical protein F5I97DRAFT_1844586 [Phlebopus sp. FC_14]|nr:hypothetical protein F5I97DRAFT_1844586 [Phlebopus sp. FC_14]